MIALLNARDGLLLAALVAAWFLSLPLLRGLRNAAGRFTKAAKE